jgi:hypothetical protein
MNTASLPEDGQLRIGPVSLPAGERIRAKTCQRRLNLGSGTVSVSCPACRAKR